MVGLGTKKNPCINCGVTPMFSCLEVSLMVLSMTSYLKSKTMSRHNMWAIVPPALLSDSEYKVDTVYTAYVLQALLYCTYINKE